jgi:hypothetical protein
MKKILGLCLLAFAIYSCNKDEHKTKSGCDIQQTYALNAQKVTITSGVWGTVSSMEGNCMPMVQPGISTCTNCPVKRTVKIYQYTLRSNAASSGTSSIFFDNFNTQLVASIDADEDGFFQANIPAGHYTIAILENGKLYANETDGQGGLNPFTLSTGILNANVTMTYRAVF